MAKKQADNVYSRGYLHRAFRSLSWVSAYIADGKLAGTYDPCHLCHD